MGRIIASLIGLGALAYVLYLYIQRGTAEDGSGATSPSAAKQTLDRTREEVKQINDDAQKRADDLLQKTE